MKSRNITREKEEKVLELRTKKYKAREIADILSLTIYQVYGVFKRFNVTKKYNIIYTLNSLQHQIIISGILGDGRLKKNGKYGYYYSECHSLKEKEYCEWKFKKLEDLTDGNKLYPKNKK